MESTTETITDQLLDVNAWRDGDGSADQGVVVSLSYRAGAGGVKRLDIPLDRERAENLQGLLHLLLRDG